MPGHALLKEKPVWIILLFVVVWCTLPVGCATPTPRKSVVVRSKNPTLQCESDAAIRKQMVRLVNAARSKARRCGRRRFPAAGPVRWNPKLAVTAAHHAKDMAETNRLSHNGSGNTSAAKRVSKTGYRWQAVAENIAGGLETSDQVVSGWLDSPGHCSNIMDKRLSEIGAACRRNRASDYGTYWTLVLAAPLQ